MQWPIPLAKMVGKDTLFISSLIISWYLSNIGVLLLNKFLLSNYGFAFPIFLTMCHMSACAAFSYISIVLFKVVHLQPIRSRSQLLKITALSIVFCSSVVGGNISLKYLPVSFNQAIGATTPFFTALFAYLMTFKREAWVTYAALVPVVAGVVIASGISTIAILITAESIDIFLLVADGRPKGVLVQSLKWGSQQSGLGGGLFE